MREHWIVLTTKPQHEFSASRLLSERGIHNYLPKYQSRSRWSDRIKLLQRPLFPRYLFAQFDGASRASALRTPGVLSILQFCGLPATVSENEVERIRAMEHNHSFPGEFMPGCKVRIVDGALSGMEGTLVSIDGRMHVQLTMRMFSRFINVPVTVDEWQLERVA